jgi:MFS family permease
MLRLHVQRPLLVATLTGLIFPWPLLVIAYHGPVAVIAVGSFGMGFAMAVFTVLWNTTMQREIPSDLLSRVSSYDWFGSLVFLPVGFALAGPISAAVGIRTAFIGASIWCVASTLVVLAVPSVYKLRTAPAKLAEGAEPSAVA